MTPFSSALTLRRRTLFPDAHASQCLVVVVWGEREGAKSTSFFFTKSASAFGSCFLTSAAYVHMPYFEKTGNKLWERKEKVLKRAESMMGEFDQIPRTPYI